jgi:hypothetical protein
MNNPLGVLLEFSVTKKLKKVNGKLFLSLNDVKCQKVQNLNIVTETASTGYFYSSPQFL